MEEERDKTKVESLPLECPVCGCFFFSWELRSFGYENRRTDFRPQYTADNPMRLYYHLCPECKFCAEQDYYQLELTEEQKNTLKARLEELYNKHGKHMSSSLAARCFYSARVAELLQQMGLIYELPFDRAQSFVQAFWWSEPEEMEKYGELALKKLQDGTKEIDEASEDTLFIYYMIGEIYRRLGRLEDARQHFEKLLGVRDKRQNESNKFLFDLAIQQMNDPRDELPEESLNPFVRP
jgi:uncharacterized protein (DUF2225 family)